jgi:hypothetical protein
MDIFDGGACKRLPVRLMVDNSRRASRNVQRRPSISTALRCPSLHTYIIFPSSHAWVRIASELCFAIQISSILEAKCALA